MNNSPDQPVRPFRTLAVLALVLWGLYAWWALGRVQSTGEMLRDSLETDWPADSGPPMGTRDRLAETADELASGQAWNFGDALAPVKPPTPDRRAAASKFLSKHPQSRSRLLALTNAARDLEKNGNNISSVREALARAYQGAVRSDENTVTVHLDLAERLLASVESGTPASSAPVDEKTVAQLAKAIEPAYRLSQDLMTEGGTAARKVLVVAAREFRLRRYAQSSTAIRLAGELLGAQIAPIPKAEMPPWFVGLAEQEIPKADPQRSTAAVELAEAMSLSMTPGDTIVTLLQKARRELDSGQFDRATWWAGITLNTLGMSDAAIAASTAGATGAKESPSNEEDTE